MIYRKVQLVSVFLSLAMSLSAAESFRVHKTIMTEVSADTQATVTAGINDAVAIMIPKDLQFMQGLEVSVKIPEQVAAYRDSVAYSMYDSVSPAPTANRIDYSGNRIHINTFPGRLSWDISIPLTETNTIKSSPYSAKVPVIPSLKAHMVFFRLQLVMKGTPESLDNAEFTITVKPILTDEGAIDLSVSLPELPPRIFGAQPTSQPARNDAEKTWTVFIDEQPVSGNPVLLKAGVHHVSVVSDFYRNEVQTVTVAQGKTTSLEIKLKDIIPEVHITAPDNAKVFFDNIAVTNTKETLAVTPGDHTVRFVIGDYEVVKSLQVLNGRSYTAALSIDATITEEE